MKALKGISALTGIAAAALTFTPMATAQNSTWEIGESGTFPAGGTITVHTPKTAKCDGEVTSTGFRAPIRFEHEAQSVFVGHGVAVDKPGTYEASAKCGGQTITHTFTIRARDAGDDLNQWVFDNPEVEAGGTIHVRRNQTSHCIGSEVTSNGFVAPIKFTADEGFTNIGQGKVIDTPGTYQATLSCNGGPVTRNFTIKAKAPEAPKPEQKPKPQIVKPKGAPQTGGGATA